jgi:4-amino-4-deoxy-L-arabinose transferase-like glycosyltransferase
MIVSDTLKPALRAALVAGLLLVLVAELWLSVRQETQTWDEGAHIYAGYSYWTRADFGINPEHPPLLKLLASLPLLQLPIRPPVLQNREFKLEEFAGAHDLLYANDAGQILLRTRMAASLLCVVLGLLIFLAASEMFGSTAGLLALLLFVFEPNFLAHGALVTTDVALSCFLFASIYAFYRYLKRPSALRLLIAGLAAGCTLASKHSGLLLFPMLLLLAGGGLISDTGSRAHARGGEVGTRMTLRRVLVACLVIGAISVAVLWSFYGLRFSARPHGLLLNPPYVETVSKLQPPVQAHLLLAAARWHLLPEAYLYGLADVKEVADTTTSYLFGEVYAHGQWFYFPAAFVIKSTVSFLLLLALLPVAFYLRGLRFSREIWFLLIPSAFYFAVAMVTRLNIGIRHILPAYPFLLVLAAAGIARLSDRNRKWLYAGAVLIALHLTSSLHAFPNYLAYANELWGGPSQTYKLLSDSNVDWGQQLKSVKRYVDQRGVKQCWFAYFVGIVAEPEYYGIPCKPLTTISSVWLAPNIDVPPEIDGPVLISAGVLSGYEFGPGELNPYDQFQKIQPVAAIDDGVFVFEGHFHIPLAAALNRAARARKMAEAGNPAGALPEMQAAAALAPRSARVQAELGYLLLRLNEKDDAREVLQRALALAQTIEPDHQRDTITALENTLAGK